MFIFMTTNEKKYPNCIREIRMIKGISAYKLAEMIGTSKDQIEKLQKGERRLTDDWLERLSKALGCTKAELLGEAPVFTAEELAMLEVFRKIETAEKRAALYNLAQTMIAPAAASPSDEKDKNAG